MTTDTDNTDDSGATLSKRRLSQRMQISPTENYLQHEYRGWCFKQSPHMCCGLVSARMEDCMRSVIHLDCFSRSEAGATENVVTPSQRSADRSTVEMQVSPTHLGRRKTIQTHSLANQLGTWKEYRDAKGRPYYHNTETNTTQWECPAVLTQVTSG